MNFVFFSITEHPWGREMLSQLIDSGFIPSLIIEETGLTGGDIKAMTSEVLGVAKSMGLHCEGKDPKEIQASIKSGSLDDRF